jgi:putative ABC transport system permease protein
MGIVFIVTVVTLFMVAGAILATANTMFNAVASRGRELATLRALGFKRRTIILAVMVESALVAVAGGIVGVILAWPVNFISTGTLNWQTFSEISFNFDVDLQVVAFAVVLALVAGVIGGLFPAMRAATLPITRALREI